MRPKRWFATALLTLCAQGRADEAGDLAGLWPGGADVRILAPALRRQGGQSVLMTVRPRTACGPACLAQALDQAGIAHGGQDDRLSFRYRQRTYTVVRGLPLLTGALGVIATSAVDPRGAAADRLPLPPGAPRMDVDLGDSRTLLLDMDSVADLRRWVDRLQASGMRRAPASGDAVLLLEGQSLRLWLHGLPQGNRYSVLVMILREKGIP